MKLVRIFTDDAQYIILFQVRNLRNKDKPLIRRKSDLPQDSGVARALTSYKRADEFLKTPPDGNKC